MKKLLGSSLSVLFVFILAISFALAFFPNVARAGLIESAAEDIKEESAFEIGDSMMLGAFKDTGNGHISYGAIFPIYTYRSLELDLGISAPTENWAGSAQLGPSVQVGPHVQKAILWGISKVPYLKDHLGILKRNEDLLRLGASYGYDFRPARWSPRIFAGFQLSI